MPKQSGQGPRPKVGRSYSLVRLLRDVRQSWTQFIAVFAMACMSVVSYSGLEGSWNGLRVNFGNYVDQTSMADIWINTAAFGQADLDRLTALPGVTGAEIRHQASGQLKLPDGEIWLDLTLVDDTAWQISKPRLMSGSPVGDSVDGVWLNDRAASYHGLTAGDQLKLAVPGAQGATTKSFELLGTILSPDQVFNVRAADLAMTAPELTSYGFITQGAAAALWGPSPVLSTTVLVRATGDLPTLEGTIREAFAGQVIALSDHSTNPTVAAAFDRVATLRNISLVFSAMFILVAVLSMYTSIRRLVDAQSKQIATLRALGFGRDELIRHFSAFGVVAGAAGAVVGLALAPLLSTTITNAQKDQFDVPDWGILYTPLPLAVAAFVVTSCLVGAVLAARSCADGEPAELLRPGVAMTDRGATKRAQSFWQRLSYPLRWALRDALANPVRIFMGVTGVVGSCMLLLAGMGLPDTIRGEIESIFGDSRAPYFARVDFMPGAPAKVIDSLPGIGGSAQLVMQLSVADSATSKGTTTVTVLGPGDFMPLTSTSGHLVSPPGVWLAQGTAEQMKLKPSDTAELTLPLNLGQAKLKVDQLTNQSTPQGFVVDRDTWESMGLPFNPTAALVGPDADLDALEDNPYVSFVVDRDTQRDNARSWQHVMSGIFLLLRLFAIGLTVIVLYSIGSLTFDERKRQYATLKVLGISTSELRALSIIDNAAVTVLGLLIGVPAGLWLLRVYVRQFNTVAISYTVQITAASVLGALLLILGVSSLTTLLLGRRISGVDVVEALKGVD